MSALEEIRIPIPFDRFRAEDIQPSIERILQQAQEWLDRIGTLEGPRTYANTMVAMDDATDRIDFATTIVRHIESVATSPEWRAAYHAVEPKISAFYSQIPLHEGSWRALVDFAATAEAKSLTGVRKRYLDKTMDFFRRHGAELDAAGKARLHEIDIALSEKTTKFAEHVLDATNAFEEVITDEAELAGLPQSAIDAAAAAARAKEVEGWRFTLQAPSYIALMTYLDDRARRERFYRAYQSRGAREPHANRELVLDILRLRREKARLLGYADFADFALADRMAKSGGRAMQFLDDLHQRTKAAFARENEELAAFRREREGAATPPLEPWDVAYLAEKERKARYDFDEEDLRPYFPLERVIAGMFETVHRLYGVTVEEVPGVPVWHPEVKYYEIREEGKTVGAFYADWHPRETKRGGAWMDSFLTGAPAVTSRHHVGVICGNLTAPVEGKPALLTHREVETIFHEFGHLLHHCLSRVEARGLSGTSVAWDFVELPSQIMENWCWERESLDLFARHWETNEPIPEDLFQKMRRARNFRVANAQMRQLSFAIVDLKLHREYDPGRDGDVVDYSRRILEEFSPVPLPSDHALILAFTHLFGNPVGYGAGYYSYKWAEVLEADAFALFLERGVFDGETGRRFRDSILAKGDSADPAELYREFRGRDPQLDALLARQGLLETSIS